ncbi:MAG: efflux RND transporter periplasmic adaptor subunit [Bacteroidales bacterium]|jgi:cobalt-zinc-cadmium efflux system membrane fusion protein|nr:efflux RND transporter periplasmic adaptor subunit [Bacteroidales bacterium]HOI32994.1 efflux RND transporter periplasmic adaptor subunit [Bacteroidales bacterium]
MKFKTNNLAFLGFWILSMALVSCDSQTTDISFAENDLIELTAEQIKETNAQLGFITTQKFSQQVNANGYLETSPNSEQLVNSLKGGRILEINVETGQKVHKGQTLVKLENPEFVEMQRAYLEAGFEVNKLREQWMRKKNLAEDQIASTSELQMAEAAYLSAVAMQQALAENLRLIQIDPEKVDAHQISAALEIKALMDGHITDISCRKGQWVNPEDQLMRLVDLSKLRLKLDVFEKDVHKLKQESSLLAYLPENHHIPIKGNIQAIGREIDAYNRTVKVFAQLSNDSEIVLMPGMFLHAYIQLESVQKKALPESAFLESDEKKYVLLLKSEENGSWFFEKRQALTGDSADGFVELLNYNDFAEGVKILISGGFQLIQEGE